MVRKSSLKQGFSPFVRALSASGRALARMAMVLTRIA